MDVNELIILNAIEDHLAYVRYYLRECKDEPCMGACVAVRDAAEKLRAAIAKRLEQPSGGD